MNESSKTLTDEHRPTLEFLVSRQPQLPGLLARIATCNPPSENPGYRESWEHWASEIRSVVGKDAICDDPVIKSDSALTVVCAYCLRAFEQASSVAATRRWRESHSLSHPTHGDELLAALRVQYAVDGVQQ